MAQHQVNTELLTDSNWINKTQSILQENIMKLFEKFFNGAHDLVYSNASFVVISIIAMFWLLNRLKDGYPSREDIFQAIRYVVICCFIFASLSSFNAYKGVLYIFTIPENVVTAVIAECFEKRDFGSMITESANKVDFLRERMWGYGFEFAMKELAMPIVNINSPMDYILASIGTFIIMIPFWIYYVAFFLLLGAITIVIFFSKFSAFLILSTMPIILPFLIFTRFMPYLWSWYKLYLSFALIAPLSFIVLQIAMNPIEEMYVFINHVEELYAKQLDYLITGTIATITCIFMLKQIPSWINAVLGTQLESGAGGIATAGVAGAVAGKTMKGGLASKAGGGSFIKGAINGATSATGIGAVATLGKMAVKAGINTAKDLATGATKGASMAKKAGSHVSNAYKQFKGGYATP